MLAHAPGLDLSLTSSTHSLEIVVGMNWRVIDWIQSFECGLSCGMCDVWRDICYSFFFSFFFSFSRAIVFFFSLSCLLRSWTLLTQEHWLVDGMSLTVSDVVYYYVIRFNLFIVSCFPILLTVDSWIIIKY